MQPPRKKRKLSKQKKKAQKKKEKKREEREFLRKEKKISKEKYAITKKIKYKGLRKAVYKKIGWTSIRDFLGADRFCSTTRSPITKYIKYSDDLFAQLAEKRTKFRRLIKKLFNRTTILKMFKKEFGLEYVKKYAPTKHDDLVIALIGALKSDNYEFDLKKREVEVNNIESLNIIHTGASIRGIHVPYDILSIIFSYIDVTGALGYIKMYNSFASVCTGFYYNALLLKTHLKLNGDNVYKIPTMVLRNAKCIELSDLGRKGEIKYIHQNISKSVKELDIHNYKLNEYSFYMNIPKDVEYTQLKTIRCSDLFLQIDKVHYPCVEHIIFKSRVGFSRSSIKMPPKLNTLRLVQRIKLKKSKNGLIQAYLNSIKQRLPDVLTFDFNTLEFNCDFTNSNFIDSKLWKDLEKFEKIRYMYGVAEYTHDIRVNEIHYVFRGISALQHKWKTSRNSLAEFWEDENKEKNHKLLPVFRDVTKGLCKKFVIEFVFRYDCFVACGKKYIEDMYFRSIEEAKKETFDYCNPSFEVVTRNDLDEVVDFYGYEVTRFEFTKKKFCWCYGYWGKYTKSLVVEYTKKIGF